MMNTMILLLVMMSTTTSRILIILFVILHTTYTTTAISMCSTFSTSGRTVKLHRNNDDDINCYCIVKLSNFSPSDTISFIKQNKPTGCQYQIQFTHHNVTKMYSCDKRDEISFFLMTQDEIQIQLVPGRDTAGRFTFKLEISAKTKGGSLALRCYNPPQSTSSLTTIRQETTSREDITTKIPQTATTTTDSPIIRQLTTITTEIPQTAIITTNNTVVRQLTTITNTNTAISQTSTNSPTNNTIILPVIIGASVGGVVLIVVLLIFILIIRRIRTRKEKPQVVTGNQVDVETPIITDNDLYISYDTVTSPNNVTIISKTDNPIITENELYVSSDQARGYGCGNHGDTEHPADVYAVVQKTSKRQECNKTDEKHNSSFIIGPHGDEYSFVNKQ